MTKASDVIDGLTALHTTIAAREATRSTGVTPGFSARLGGTVTPDGRLRYVAGGAGHGELICSTYTATPQTVNSGVSTIIDHDVVIYDPGSTVTTGVDWICVPGAIGWYLMIFQQYADRDAGNFAAFDSLEFDIKTGAPGLTSSYRTALVPTIWATLAGALPVAFVVPVQIEDVTHGMQIEFTHLIGLGTSVTFGVGQGDVWIDVIRV